MEIHIPSTACDVIISFNHQGQPFHLTCSGGKCYSLCSRRYCLHVLFTFWQLSRDPEKGVGTRHLKYIYISRGLCGRPLVMQGFAAKCHLTTTQCYQLCGLELRARSSKQSQNDHDLVKEAGEKSKKLCNVENSHEKLVPLIPTYKLSST